MQAPQVPGGLSANPMNIAPPKPRISLDRLCRWTVALSDSTDMASLKQSGMVWDYYTVGNRTWILTERNLVRSPVEPLPEILEIDGPSLVFGTSLAPAGPNRWYLPKGKPFAIAVTYQP